MALSLVRAKALHGNSHSRFFASISTMKKGLVLGVYETDDENKVALTSTAAKYNELVKGQLWKYILL
ncbi:hypothetical protein EAI_10406 [Harpegnathos saltator]|uniref:Uncharacterized protein n=2 Tax=Harpegnathos saltator TaxID=610380 RepID=E2B9F1_HARSA|nr:hypothetical protein EAI_10406 [Harpegnathos saltator]